MNAAGRIGAFLAGVAVLGGASAALGAALDPSAPGGDGGGHGGGGRMATGHGGGGTSPSHGAGHGGTGGMSMGHGDAMASAPVSGALRLVLARDRVPRGTLTTLRFRIADPDGHTVRDFDVQHARRLHLIVVRTDLSTFQHLHPTQVADGSWRVRTTLTQAGTYRVIADVVPHGGEATAVTADVFVPGAFTPVPLPPPADRATAAGGYRVTLSRADQGDETRLRFAVTRGGRPVALEPYLGARGHLVSLRDGDLEYLHVHPEATDAARGLVTFAAHVPSTGRYRLFLQFRHAGAVHTAALTQEVTGR